jgi:hypothetical protein
LRPTKSQHLQEKLQTQHTMMTQQQRNIPAEAISQAMTLKKAL